MFDFHKSWTLQQNMQNVHKKKQYNNFKLFFITVSFSSEK